MSKGKGPRTSRGVAPADALPPLVRVTCDSRHPERVRAVIVLREAVFSEGGEVRPKVLGLLTVDARTLDGTRERVAGWCAALGWDREEAREAAQAAVAVIRRMGRR